MWQQILEFYGAWTLVLPCPWDRGVSDTCTLIGSSDPLMMFEEKYVYLGKEEKSVTSNMDGR